MLCSDIAHNVVLCTLYKLKILESVGWVIGFILSESSLCERVSASYHEESAKLKKEENACPILLGRREEKDQVMWVSC